MNKELKFRFEVTVSASPTERDSIGCDGLFIKDVQMVPIEEFQKTSEFVDGMNAYLSKHLADHIEKFAAAFVQETKLDPTRVNMVSCWKGMNYRIWFEPFPTQSDIEGYRKRAEEAERIVAVLKERLINAPSTNDHDYEKWRLDFLQYGRL